MGLTGEGQKAATSRVEDPYRIKGLRAMQRPAVKTGQGLTMVNVRKIHDHTLRGYTESRATKPGSGCTWSVIYEVRGIPHGPGGRHGPDGKVFHLTLAMTGPTFKS